MPNTKNAIEIKNIKKTYKNGKEALKGITLNIPKGSMFALLGPNGAGKSTLINTIASVIKKDSGSITLWGLDMDKNPRDVKATIGIVPQEITIDPFFTPIQVLEIEAGMFGIRNAKKRCEEILKMVNLWENRNFNSRELSGGMKRRLLIAKALVHKPPIIVLDEPTAGVDIELRNNLWKNIKELNKKGTTVIVTTHYLEEAENLCTDIAIISEGNLILNDKMKNVLKSLNSSSLKLITNEKKDCLKNKQLKEIKYTFEKGIYTINYNRNNISVNELINIFSKENIVITDINIKEQKLEEIFLDITSKNRTKTNS